MKFRSLITSAIVAALLTSGLLIAPTAAFAAGIVGTGTAISCTDAALTAAIAAAGTITFNCGSAPVTILVSSPKTITLNTVIDGANLITLDGGSQSYFFYVNNFQGVSFTVQNLKFVNGKSDQEGGAIHAHYKSNLTVTNCTFTNNTTTSATKQFDGGGGAIFVGSAATATISASTFTNNSGANGGAIYSLNSTLSVSASTFTGNLANLTSPKSGSGGAIWNDTGAITVTNSVFSGNSALYQGGALAVSPDNIHPTGNFVVTNTIFSNNSSYYQNQGNGGAIFNQQPLTVVGSTFSGNTGRDGGALWLGANSTLANDTIANNSAVSPDGQHGLGGGLNITGGVVSLINVTIAGNYADFMGGGVFGTASGTVKNTIIANNVAHNGGNNWNIQNQCSTALANGGHNLVFPKDDCGFGSSALKDPTLAALANNGGPTQTMALLAGSPAIDTGDNTTCAATPVNNVDQRGQSRPVGPACDIGAFESTLTFTASIDTIGVFRSGTFYLRLHNSTGVSDITVAFNSASKPYPVAGDWVGNGYDTVGVYDQINGLFTLRNSNTPGTPDEQFALGNPNDIPLSGHWSASVAHAAVGVFRPSNGLIYLKNTLTTGFADYTMVLGIPGDDGLAGDWNGDGFDSPGVYRPSPITFYLTDQVCNCSAIGNHQLQYGVGGDAPVIGDWIGQGHDGVGLFRQSNGFTYLRNGLTTGYADITFTYGIAGDVPIAGHWQLVYPPAPNPIHILVPSTGAPMPTVVGTPGSGLQD
ncbi:MAG: choice-of-anchor Q domain-containing protein [Aggregatilineales bacterium]